MKRSTIFTFLAFVAGLVFAFGAMAEQRSGVVQTGDRATMGQLDLHSGEQFIGTQVRDARGEELGRVTDVMINFREGGVGYAEVTARDGQTYLVPLNAFRTTDERDFVMLDTDERRMAAAPRMEPGVTAEEYRRSLHEHYGVAYPWGDLPGAAPIRQEDTPAPGLTYPGHRDVIPAR